MDLLDNNTISDMDDDFHSAIDVELNPNPSSPSLREGQKQIIKPRYNLIRRIFRVDQFSASKQD